jgi:hypothetical protein
MDIITITTITTIITTTTITTTRIDRRDRADATASAPAGAVFPCLAYFLASLISLPHGTLLA